MIYICVDNQGEACAVQETLLEHKFVWNAGQTHIIDIPGGVKALCLELHNDSSGGVITYRSTKPTDGTVWSIKKFAENYKPSQRLETILQRKETLRQEKELRMSTNPKGTKGTKKKTKAILSPIYRPRNLDNVIKKVNTFYSSRDIYTAPLLYENIMEAYVDKKKALKPIFGASTTMRLNMEGNLEKFQAFSTTDLGIKALYELQRGGVHVEPEDVINNKVKVGKQTMKLTKWLLKNGDDWDENTLGELYNGLQVDDIILSIDPYEFQTASENCGWSSCFRTFGEYHCSVWAFYRNKYSAILKVKNKYGVATFRIFIIFDLDQGTIYFGRIYGALDSTIYKIIREKLERLVAKTLKFENRWVISRNFGVDTDFDDSNTYIDDMSCVAVPKHIHKDHGFNNCHLRFPSGWDSGGYPSEQGEFTVVICERCGRNTGTYSIDDNDDALCPDCA